MAQFDIAFRLVAAAEGRIFVDESDDPGGATKEGISLRFLRTLTGKSAINDGYMEGDLNHDGTIDVNDVKDLTDQQIFDLYQRKWWIPSKYGQFTQRVANKLFITAINIGMKPANGLLQRALMGLGAKLAEDGVIGDSTVNAVRVATLKHGESAVLAAYRSEQAGYYRALAAKNPKLNKFLAGWLNRAYA